MSIWFFINFVVFIFAIWKISTGHLGIQIIFGGLGLLFVLYNWTRHAVFSTIRSNISRKRKIKYATFSKKVLPIHKYTGSTALLLIIIHSSFIFYFFGFQLTNMKMLTGLFAGITLTFVVLTGWLRFIRTTYHRRIVHLVLGYCLFSFIVLHLIF